MAPRSCKKACKRAASTPPDVRKLRKQQKVEINQRLALDLVRKTDSSRKRADTKVVQELFSNYKQAYGEDMVDNNAVYQYKQEIMNGAASTWLPSGFQLPSQVVVNVDNLSEVSGLTGSSPDKAAPWDTSCDTETEDVCKRGGRPKNTTKAAKSAHERNLEAAKHEAAERYVLARGNATGKYVQDGTLSTIITDVEVKYHLVKGTLSHDTIRTRARRNNPSGKGRGHMSPLNGMEHVIVDFCVKLARMGAPLDRNQVILLANDLMKGTIYQERLALYKKKHTCADEVDKVGVRWYYNFMRRNGHILKSVVTRTCDSKRWDYIRRENFEIMYDCVYEKMVEAGVAMKFSDTTEPVMYDSEGQPTEDKDAIVGMPLSIT